MKAIKLILLITISIILSSCYRQVDEPTIKVDSVYWIQGDSVVFVGVVPSVEQ